MSGVRRSICTLEEFLEKYRALGALLRNRILG